jgi:hypothetical protein
MRTSLCLCARWSIALVAAVAVGGCSSSPTSPSSAVALSGVLLSAGTVLSGLPVTGTVTLATPAPAAGASVTLASSSSAAAVPTSVTIPSGATTQTFTISTVGSTTTTTVTITATYLGTSQTTTLTMLAGASARGLFLSLAETSVAGGASVIGTVTLAAAAPAEGAVVALASSGPAATVPTILAIDPGATSQTFEIATRDSPAATTVTITATYSGSVQTATLTVARLALQSLTLAENAVPGGLPVLGLITLTVAAPPGGVSVALSSSSASATVPPSVTVPEGSTLQTFEIDTINSPPTAAATITATYAATSRTAALTVTGYPVVTGVTCSPSNPPGGTSVDCAGTLAAPAPRGGWQLALTSSDASAMLPDSLTIPEAGAAFQFTVTTTAVTSATTVLVRITDVRSGFLVFTEALLVTN